MAIIIELMHSGADVALFPLSMADYGEGELQFSTKTKLQDAQGNRIPRGGAKSVDISLPERDGREVLLKENVIFSSKVNQPTLCYGRLMELGWGINNREHMLENGDFKVPLNLQNRSLTVQGRIRVIRDEGENCLEVQLPPAPEKESRRRVNEHGC